MADRPEPPQTPAGGLDVDLEVTNESIRLRFKCSTGVAVLLGVTGVTLGKLYGKEKIQPVIERLFNSVFGFCKLTPGSIVVDVDCFSAKRVKELLDDYKCGKLKRRFVEELRKIDGEVENLRITFELNETLKMNTNHTPREEKQSGKTREGTEGMSEQEYLETLESIKKLDGETERLIELAQKWSYRNIYYNRELETSDEHGRTISHYAAVVRNEHLLEYLSDLQLSEFNARDCDGRNVLHLACIPTDPSIRKEGFTDPPHSYRFNVNRLLRCFSVSKAKDAQDSEDRTPLHYAAMSTYYEDNNVEVLIQNGADIYAMDAYGKTPLEYALQYGGTNAMECLLEHHGREKAKKVKRSLKIMRDINTVDEEGRNILHKAVAFASPEALFVLLEAGVDMSARDKIGKTALHYAFEYLNISSAVTILDYLLETQRKEEPVHSFIAIFSKNFKLKDSHYRTMLHNSVIRFKQNVLNLLLTHGVEVNGRDDSGKTPLHYAFEHGNVEAAEKLLEAGASVDLRDANGRTVVHYAAKRSEEKLTNLLEELIQNDADIYVMDSYGKTPLEYALQYGGANAMECLLKHHGREKAKKVKRSLRIMRDINTVDDEGRNILHKAAAFASAEALLVLLETGVDMNAKDKIGKTAFDYALEHSNVESAVTILDVLLEKQSKEELVHSSIDRISKNFQLKDSHSRTMLHHSVIYSKQNVFNLLLSQDMDMNDRDDSGKTPLHYAFEHGNVEAAEKLLEAGASVDLKDANGKTVVHLAAKCGDEKLFDLLARSKANLNVLDNESNSGVYYAIKMRNVAIAEKLVKAGASVEGKDSEGGTVLHLAAYNGDKNLFDLLFKNNGNKVEETDKKGNSVLFYAVQGSNDAIAEKLIKAGATVDGKNDEGKTVLHLAAENNGDEKLTDLLLRNKAKVNDVDDAENSAFYYAVSLNKLAIAEKLIEAGARVDEKFDEGKTFLHLAAEKGDKKLIDLLLTSNANVNDIDSKGNSVLSYAVRGNMFTIVKKLIKAGARVDEKYAEGKTVLHIAAEKGDETLIILLLTSNANVNDIDSKGNSALTYAVRGSMLTIAYKLIRAGASVDRKDSEGQTVLYIATKRGDENMIDLLLASNANVNDVDSKGNSVLSYALRGNMSTIVNKFIKAGARVDEKFDEGKTVLHLAVEKGDEKLINLLLASNANVNDIDSKGNSALTYAVRGNMFTIVHKLTKAGARVEEQCVEGQTVLHFAAEMGDENLIDKLLAENVNVNDIDFKGNSALHYAVRGGKIAIVEKLIKAGASVERKGDKGRTALHIAAQLNDEKMIDLLLENKVNVNEIDDKGNSALYFTVERGNLVIAEKLVKAGASISRKNDEGQTVLHLAREQGDNQLIDALLKTRVSIGPSGGVIQLDDVTLKLGAECLLEDTQITLVNKTPEDFPTESFLDLGLVKVIPRVVEFLPNHLKFLKPAVLMIKLERPVSDFQLFILHGSYHNNYQKITWEVVSNSIERDDVEGVSSVKINGFSLYSFILAMRGMLARILCHLNYSFVCRAYVLYRRISSKGTVDIAVVFVSEFVDDNNEDDIKQLKDHFEGGYRTGEKGKLACVNTDRRYEISLNFTEVKICHSFEINQAQLDSDGYAINCFAELASPANGNVEIREESQNTLLWKLTVCEIVQETEEEKTAVHSTETEPIQKDVRRTTKLTNAEICRMSCRLGLDWDSLAGLLDIPYYDREEIRFNFVKFSSKSEQVFQLFNKSQSFDRNILVKCLKEIKRQDLIEVMLPHENEAQTQTEDVETRSLQTQDSEDNQLVKTRLSSRELYRLSRGIVVDWENLAALLDVPVEDRNIIRTSNKYHDGRSRAEKMLSIFNRREDFSREKLVRCLEEIGQLELIEPISSGEWRNI